MKNVKLKDYLVQFLIVIHFYTQLNLFQKEKKIYIKILPIFRLLKLLKTIILI